MRKIFLTLAFTLATMISANSQTIIFGENKLFFNADAKYLCDDNDEIYGTFTLECSKSRYFTAPYTIHQKGRRVIVYIEVLYDNNYNYPIGSLLPNVENKYLNDDEKFELISQITFMLEAIYRNIIESAKYGCK